MKERLLKRLKTSGRVDDNVATFEKRYEGYLKESLPLINHLRATNARLIEVSGSDELIIGELLTKNRYPQLKTEKKDGSNSRIL